MDTKSVITDTMGTGASDTEDCYANIQMDVESIPDIPF